MKGYMGKLLRVNLSARQVTEEPLDPQWARDYIGGTGLGVRLAYGEVPPDADPLGPQAKLFLMTGPVTATSLSTAGRYQVVYKSPLTGIFLRSNLGGFFGPAAIQVGACLGEPCLRGPRFLVQARFELVEASQLVLGKFQGGLGPLQRGIGLLAALSEVFELGLQGVEPPLHGLGFGFEPFGIRLLGLGILQGAEIGRAHV